MKSTELTINIRIDALQGRIKKNMDIKTLDGIDIYCHPEIAYCKAAGKDIEDISECPIRAFDLAGDICHPDACEYYTEDSYNIPRKEE